MSEDPAEPDTGSPTQDTSKIPEMMPSRFIEHNITEALDHMK